MLYNLRSWKDVIRWLKNKAIQTSQGTNLAFKYSPNLLTLC
jgi:hypothetical protein